MLSPFYEYEELEQNNSYFGEIKLNALAPWWEPEIKRDKDSLIIESDDELLVSFGDIEWLNCCLVWKLIYF